MNKEEMKNATPLILMRDIVKTYHIGKENELEILHGISLNVYQGEFLSIVGESGSGKSTLMNIIGTLDRQTEGTYMLGKYDISKTKDSILSDIRNEKIGFVFQNFNLLSRLSAVKNVEFPMTYAGIPAKRRKQKAMELLEMVGMKDRMNHKPSELSGGQKQRVAIARALANDPDIILADEPTGALDKVTGRNVMDIFHRLHEMGKTIILVTHNNALAEETDRVITIADGRVIGDLEE